MTVARNSLYSLAGAVVPLAVNLVTVPLYIAAIGAERYGALLIAWVLLGYFGQADFGIGRAITQRLASMRGAEAPKVADAVWSALATTLAFSAVTGLLLYVLGGQFFGTAFQVDEGLRAELLASLWMLALCVPVVAIGGVLTGALMGRDRFALATGGTLASNIALQALPLAVALLAGPRLDWLIAASLTARVIGLVIPAAGVWARDLRGQRPRPSRGELATLAQFGAWVMVSAIVGPLMISSDRFVIGALAGAVAVAAYSIPFQIAARTAILPISLVQALFPRFAEDEADQAHRRCGEATVFVGQVYAPLVIVLACLAGPLLRLWLGDALDPRSIIIGQIVLAGFWANAVANVPYSYIQARGNPRFTALLHVAELPVYLGLLFALGSRWGLAGFAAAYSLRCALDAVVLAAKAGVWRKTVLSPLAGPALLVLAAVAAGQAFQTWPSALASASALGGTAAVLAWRQMPAPARARLRSLIASRGR